MHEKKVSIVLPVYNGSRYIASSIESVLGQSYVNWELIVINDCSTDDTLEICRKYGEKDSRIRVFSNERNLKLPRSLNVGFEKATGEYYTWTSDDNMYKKAAIETMARALDENPSTSMVYANYTNMDANGDVINESNLPEPKFIVMGNICGACFLYRADVAKLVGKYDTDMFLAEDYDYWLRICRNGKLMHITDNLYFYRRHSESLSETRKVNVAEQTFKVIEKNFFSMYVTAKQNGLKYDFFDYMLRCSEPKEPETRRMLITLDKCYWLHLEIREIKKSSGYKKCQAEQNMISTN